MPGVTYKCPSCGGYLAFDPEKQRWKCPFCDSEFEQSGLSEQDEASAHQHMDGEQLVYRCPSCGSEIMTDETTVAAQCYYCHSPVVLEGKLTPEYLPDSVIPFTIDKDKAVETFMKWVKFKRYVPKGFYSQAQVEKMTGVYYPHFVTECVIDGVLDGEGRQTSVMDSGHYIVTSTRHYRVRREARIRLRDIMRPALTKTNRKLSDGIHPFPLQNAVPFAPAYLSGFLAERRDMEQSAIRHDIEEEAETYVKPLLLDSVHYDSHSMRASSSLRSMNSRYVLLPTWVLTYPNPKDPKDPYYYAMNGCTGEICGKLPVDKKKLFSKALTVFGGVLVVALILSYFLF